MIMKYELKICHLYNDLLNLYGDRGNVIALKKRCEWRGIDVDISNVSTTRDFNSDEYDIVFIGGGQDFEQEILQEDLLSNKRDELIKAVNLDVVFLCICGGYQLMGKYYETHYGTKIDLLGALDLWTIGGEKRMIGDFVFECDLLKLGPSGGRIVGFENHAGKTYLGEGVKPLGKVCKGNGNNGEDGMEGAIYKNVYCSYSHGSLLPKNPELADHLIELALKRKYKEEFYELQSIDDNLENLAHDIMTNRVMSRPNSKIL